jgi:hypothetical protein
MSIIYDPARPSGKRFTIQAGERVYRDVPATIAERLLRTAGLKCGEARERLAMARLNAATS